MFIGKKREIFFIITIFFTIYFICKKKGSDNDKKFYFNNKSGVLLELNWRNGSRVAMNDPRLINGILTNFLIQPADQTLHPLTLKGPNIDRLKISQRGQTEIIKNILNNQKGGFFIEAGAYDGEVLSNTLYFETYNNWSGLLIEPDPLNFAQLMKKNRRAWISNTCVGVHPYPEMVEFKQEDALGTIVKTGVKEEEARHWGIVTVQCIPLYSYLLALNITNVDYLSLDVEGAELKVLKTIPFQLINIQTISVEIDHVDGGKDAVAEYMISQGYAVHDFLSDDGGGDLIFVKK